MANKLNWNGKEIDGWLFDGKELKPKSGANFNNTYAWDGKEFKPKSGATFNNTWVVSGGKCTPKSGANFNNTWDVGNAPVPVIIGKVIRLY